MKTKSTFLLLFLLIGSGLSAQMSVRLDSFTVTASRVPVSIKNTGKSVTVLESEEIADLPVTTVDELLRYIVGVNVNARNGFGVQTDFGIRGSTFAQVLVMIDNVRLNDPLTAHFNNNIPVSIAEIDHIEIIRGAASASFGADAVGGVIHIKTKAYTAREAGNELQLIGNAGVGDHNLYLSDLGVFGRFNRLILSAGIKTAISDGEELVNPNFAQGTSSDSLFNNYFDLKTYSASLAYLLNDYWKAQVRVGFDRRDFSAKYFYTRSTFDESTETTESLWNQFILSREKGRHRTEFNAGYKKTEDLFVFNPLFTPNEHLTERTTLNLVHNYQFKSKGQLAIGAQLDQRMIESTDRGDHQNFATGIYSVLSYPVSRDFMTNISLRYEYDDNFGSQLLPQFSFSYIQDKYLLRGSAGKSFRAGDFTERFISSQLPNLSPGRNIGNPDLKAEVAYNFDLGIDWYPAHDLFLSGTVFYRASDNLIDYTLTNSNFITNVTNLQPNEEYFYATNVSNSNTAGVELQLEKIFQYNEGYSFKSRLGYTYLRTTNSDGGVSKYIANHPNHSVSVMLDWNTPYFQLSSITNFISREEETVEAINAGVSSEYSVTNLKAGIRPGTSNFLIYAEVMNLFDADYQEILGAKNPGRWLVAGLQWNITTKPEQTRNKY